MRSREGSPLRIVVEGGSQLLPLSSNVEGGSPLQVTSSLHLHPHLPQAEAVPRRPIQVAGVQAPHHVPILQDPMILEETLQGPKTQRAANTMKMMTTSSMCTLMAKNKLRPSRGHHRLSNRQRLPS